MKQRLRQYVRWATAITAAVLLLPMILQAQPPQPAPIVTDQWIVEIADGLSPQVVADQFNLFYVGPLANMPGYHILRAPAIDTRDLKAVDTLTADLTSMPGVTFASPDYVSQMGLRIPPDPLYGNQWHLNNTGQIIGGLADVDIDAPEAWALGYTGKGVRVAIVDDGVQHTHPDIAPNYIGGYDYGTNTANIPPGFRGTALAGLVAAANDGVHCGVGVAYDASLFGVSVYSSMSTSNLAAALAHGTYDNTVDISSNSWGRFFDVRVFGGVHITLLNAIANGATYGRNGKGIIYVWPIGDDNYGPYDGEYYDQSGSDSFVNSRYTIPVGSILLNGTSANLSEEGAALIVSAPSGNFPLDYGDFPTDGTNLTTTDLMGADGFEAGNCTNQFPGTWAASSIVSGVVALMLQANPNLTWRDVQAILIETAVKNDPTNTGWALNGYGNWVHHRYGYGLVKAAAAVQMARTWRPLGPEFSYDSGNITGGPLEDGGTITRVINVPDAINVESVIVRINGRYNDRGSLRVRLTSPEGTESILLEPRFGDFFYKYDDDHSFEVAIPVPRFQVPDYYLRSMRHWGELSTGNWTIEVIDTNPSFDSDPDSGTIKFVGLTIYGTSALSTPLIANGGFESTYTAANGHLMPNDWNVLNAANGGSRVRPTAYTGANSFRFGPGGTLPQNISIVQRQQIAIPAGEGIEFGGIAQTASMPPGTRIRLRVIYADNTIGTINVPVAGGTQSWRAYGKSLIFSKPVKDVRMTLMYSNATRLATSVLFDDMYINHVYPPTSPLAREAGLAARANRLAAREAILNGTVPAAAPLDPPAAPLELPPPPEN